MDFPPLVLSALLCAALPLAAGDWPGFRGGDARAASAEKGFPDTFTEKDFAWNVALPGTGVSSPAVKDGRLYLTADTGSGGKRLVLCLRATDGGEVWRHEDNYEAHAQHRFNSFASSTPCVDGNRVYISWTSGGAMTAMALTLDGKPSWRTDLGPYQEEHGSGASPVLADGVLVVVKDNVGPSSFLFGLNPEDGSVIWKLPRQNKRTPFATPVVLKTKTEGAVVIFAGQPHALTAVRARDGKLLWEVENEVPDQRAVGSPAVAGDIVYMTVGSGGAGRGSVAVKVSEEKGELVWQSRKGMPYVTSPLGLGDHIYTLGDGGILSCVNAGDGSEVWSERVFSDKAYSSPVAVDGKIFCVSRNGSVAVVASGPEFRILGTGALGGECDATPAVSDGRMFFRTRDHLLCLPASAAPARP